jgi:hypothetical protein
VEFIVLKNEWRHARASFSQASRKLMYAQASRKPEIT